MTKLGVLSDTHLRDTQQRLPQTMLEAFKEVDYIIHAGDWVSLVALEQLKPFAEVIGVQGNMDDEAIRAQFPDVQEMEIAGYRVGVTHGWGPPANIEKRILMKFSTPPDLLIFGHTHRALCQKEGNCLIFNPGSPTDTLHAERRTFGLITLGETIQWNFLELE